MNTHEAGRATAAWRERNAGADAPGTGQDEPVKVPYTADQRNPHDGSTDPYATDTKQTTNTEKTEPAKGLSTKNSPGLLGRRKS